MKATFRSTTRYAWILVQIAADGPQDYAEVNALQDELTLTPLSAWGRPLDVPSDVPVDPTVDTTATPFDQVRLMTGTTFFERLATLMVDNPPYPDDAPILKKLKAIGVEPGKDFDAEHLDPKHADAFNRAARAVFGKLETAPYEMKTVNGWLLALNLGRYETNYNIRAFVAFFGLGALPAEDCVYSAAFVDEDGRPLDGANEYVIHFDEDRDLPLPQRCMVHLGVSRERIRPQPDRAICDLVGDAADVQHRRFDRHLHPGWSPGPDREPNWLPCPPSGLFNLTARAYQPKDEILDGRTEDGLVVEAGSYAPPPVKRVARI